LLIINTGPRKFSRTSPKVVSIDMNMWPSRIWLYVGPNKAGLWAGKWKSPNSSWVDERMFL